MTHRHSAADRAGCMECRLRAALVNVPVAEFRGGHAVDAEDAIVNLSVILADMLRGWSGSDLGHVLAAIVHLKCLHDTGAGPDHPGFADYVALLRLGLGRAEGNA